MVGQITVMIGVVLTLSPVCLRCGAVEEQPPVHNLSEARL
jgi:hypothetical protein